MIEISDIPNLIANNAQVMSDNGVRGRISDTETAGTETFVEIWCDITGKKHWFSSVEVANVSEQVDA